MLDVGTALALHAAISSSGSAPGQPGATGSGLTEPRGDDDRQSEHPVGPPARPPVGPPGGVTRPFAQPDGSYVVPLIEGDGSRWVRASELARCARARARSEGRRAGNG